MRGEAIPYDVVRVGYRSGGLGCLISRELDNCYTRRIL